MLSFEFLLNHMWWVHNKYVFDWSGFCRLLYCKHSAGRYTAKGGFCFADFLQGESIFCLSWCPSMSTILHISSWYFGLGSYSIIPWVKGFVNNAVSIIGSLSLVSLGASDSVDVIHVIIRPQSSSQRKHPCQWLRADCRMPLQLSHFKCFTDFRKPCCPSG